MKPTDTATAASNVRMFAAEAPQPWQLGLEHLMSGKSVLSVFSGSCALGMLAAKAGASFVVNIDHDENAIAQAKAAVRQSALPIRPRIIASDAFAAMRQLAGIGQNARVRGKLMPSFPKLEARQFDMVVIDPPLHSKSLFGVVDLRTDYASIFKPALLCTALGGILVCTNRVENLDRGGWIKQLERAAAKAGRPIKTSEWLESAIPSAPCVALLHLA